MSKHKKFTKKIGLPPGSLVHVGEKISDNVVITAFSYDANTYIEKTINNIDDVANLRDEGKVLWIDIDGLHNVDLIAKTGNIFNLHPLLLEDILNTNQRIKYQDYGDCIFVVLNMIFYPDDTGEHRTEQVSIVFGKDFVISFQEQRGDIFDPIRKNIRNNMGRIRKFSSDFLTYSLIDALVDNYYIFLEKNGEIISEIENESFDSVKNESLKELHKLKGRFLLLRKAVWPLRDVLFSLEKSDSHLILSSSRVYFRDVYDHSFQIIDTLETYREMINGLIETYHSEMNIRLNEVMKVLTIISTVFIPLTFIAGIYGMNFENIPELKWHWGYYFTLAIMLTLGALMLAVFKRKKWF